MRLKDDEEKLEQWMVEHGFATGHGDTIEDLLKELERQIDVDAVNMSQECVDETAKDRLIRIMGTFDLATGHADTMEQVLDALEDELRDVLGHLRARHEWVGLTDEEIYDYADKFLYQHGSNYGIRSFGKAIEAKLKERNS